MRGKEEAEQGAEEGEGKIGEDDMGGIKRIDNGLG